MQKSVKHSSTDNADIVMLRVKSGESCMIKINQSYLKIKQEIHEKINRKRGFRLKRV
jgi:hypothetical protein